MNIEKISNEDIKEFINQDITILDTALDFFKKTNFGVSEFQIKNFVLNKNEFPTEWSKFKQAKIELWSRLCAVMDDYFNYKTSTVNIELEQAKIKEEYNDNTEISKAKIKLSEIEIEKNNFKIETIKKQVNDKLKEMQIFFDIVKDEKEFDNETEEKRFWEEKIKNNPQIFAERYGIMEP